MAGRLKVVKVNVDEAPAVSARYDARSIPTLLILDRGEVKARQVGAVPADALLRRRESGEPAQTRGIRIDGGRRCRLPRASFAAAVAVRSTRFWPQAPMPTPWARWRLLPSLCRAGATMTSAFWNSFTVS